MRTASTHFVVISVLVIVVGMAFGLMRVFAFGVCFLILLGGALTVSAGVFKFCSAAGFDEAFYSDPNLLLAVERIGLWKIIFDKSWRAQHQLTLGRRRYRTSFWLCTASALLVYGAILSLTAAVFLLVHEVGRR